MTIAAGARIGPYEITAPLDPNIAQIHGVEENTGVLALVMEFVDGPTLYTWFRRLRSPIKDRSKIRTRWFEEVERMMRGAK